LLFNFSTIRRPPTSPLFPYTTLFRSRDSLRPRRLLDRRQLEVRADPVAVRGQEGHQDGAGRENPGRDEKPRVVVAERLPRLRERSEEHTSELQSRENLVCRLLLEKKK